MKVFVKIFIGSQEGFSPPFLLSKLRCSSRKTVGRLMVAFG
ncbi:hypothetical protein HMPREF1870_01901 [Bacteroidales bacterium KA00344]|nr:hypothetical protein HMPREF1870_01901 [Bacteroidales bacterium KA00344]